MPRKYIILAVSVTIGCLALIIGSWIASQPKAYIELHAAPETVTLKSSSLTRTASSGDTLTVKPGNYIFTVSADDFEPATYTVNLEKDETTKLYISLEPQNASAKKQLDSAEARKIREQAKALEKEKLLALLPIDASNFSILAVPALKHPGTDRRDIFINVTGDGGEAAARANITSLKFAIEPDEILAGSNRQYTIHTAPNYEIKAMFDASSPDAPLLYVNLINMPYVSRDAPTNPQREGIRTDVLAYLKEQGYDSDKYDIYYTDHYLSKYSPTLHDHATHGQAHP